MTNLPFELLPEMVNQVFQQDYSNHPEIEGVKTIDISNFLSDEGDFSELFRLDEKGHLEMFPDFQLRQINRTLLFANSIKAWHVHAKQDEIWYLPPQHHLVVGLWDLRKNSSTANVKRKIILGGGSSRAIFIPKGVAHGSANFSSLPVQLYYFVNLQFNQKNPDEMRLHWDALGADFWTPERD